MWRWLNRFFPARTLDGVGSGALCDLVVKVVSPDAIASTIAPTRAAVVRWTLLYESTEQESHNRARSSRLRAFATGWRGGPFVVRAACGRTIEVGLDDARLIAPFDPEDGTPLGTSPASAQLYGTLAARAPANAGPLYVREHAITQGQSLVVRAWIEPTQRDGGYRDAAFVAAAQFRASRGVVLEDRLA